MKHRTLHDFEVDPHETLGVAFELVDPDESVRAETLDGSSYEPGMARLLDRACSEFQAPIVLDVGAHYGYFTCLLSKLHPRSRVLAFEPGAKQFDVLAHNVALNYSSASTMRIALSDQIGQVDFTDRTLKVKNGFPTESVFSTTWDSFADTHGLRADIVKIDVHGAEGKVLAGMKQALRDQIKHVLVEVHADYLLVDYTHADILQTLREAGFDIHECIDFRKEIDPKLVLLDTGAQKVFSDPHTWTGAQIKYERLIYATRTANAS